MRQNGMNGQAGRAFPDSNWTGISQSTTVERVEEHCQSRCQSRLFWPANHVCLIVFEGAMSTSQNPSQSPTSDQVESADGVAAAEVTESSSRTAVGRNWPSVVVSVVLHAALLMLLALWKFSDADASAQVAPIQTVVAEERTLEQFTEELDDTDEIADSINFFGGSVAAATTPAAAGAVTIEPERVIEDPDFEVRIAPRQVFSSDRIGDDLGETSIAGEVGAIVDGYGAALDRLTQELMRLMRSQRLLVVWVFDESGSMKDDQEEIKQRIDRVYQELKLVDDQSSSRSKTSKSAAGRDVLLTAISSFGAGFHLHTRQPTSDVTKILQAIDRIPVDDTGVEMQCAAVLQAMDRFGGTLRSGRKLVLVVVSDESGDDGLRVDEVRTRSKSLRCPIYVLGREAVFGSLYAHVRWKHPQTGVVHYLPIRRGPETPFAEQLQYDGFRKRRDAHMSGFGPYEQVRMARDSNGIFFQLPHEQENLNDWDGRKFESLALKEYLPSLDSRRVYVEGRDASEFRKAVWEVIALLNPYDKDKEKVLNIPEGETFSIDPRQSANAVKKRITQIMSIVVVMRQALQRMTQVSPLRAREPSLRWRANFDLMYAQLYAYQVRLFQYAIALDQFAKTVGGRIKDPRHNRWFIRHGSGKLIFPDAQQERFLKVTAADVKDAHERAMELLAQVKQEHPATPWARRAEWEEKRKFGATFGSYRYVKPPPRTNKPRPKPSPPPKL